MTENTTTEEEQKSAEGIIIKEKYPVVCIFCSGFFSVGPSIAMMSGFWNIGSASCPHCNERNFLSIDLKTNERMISHKTHSELFGETDPDDFKKS